MKKCLIVIKKMPHHTLAEKNKPSFLSEAIKKKKESLSAALVFEKIGLEN